MKEIIATNGTKIIVSNGDYNRLSKHIWHIDKRGYAYRFIYGKKRKKRLSMHIELMEKKKGFIIDHANRIRTDNRTGNGDPKSEGFNLRHITPAQNARNRQKYKGISKYKGVIFTNTGKYRAQIGFNYKQITIGIFDTEKQAAAAYDIWARKLDILFVNNFEENDPIIEEVKQMLDEKDKFTTKRRRELADTIGAGKSKFRGVLFDKSKNAYIARIGYKGSKYKLGSSKNPEDCAVMYDSAARILLEHKAILNFPDIEPIEKIINKANTIIANVGKKDLSDIKIIEDKDRQKTPGLRGVYIHNYGFAARIYYDDTATYLGTYKTAEEAALAYNNAAIERYGDKAKINKL